MAKKIIILSFFLLFLTTSSALAIEKERFGFFSRNPLSLVKNITSNVKLSFTFGKINKAEKLVELAKNKLDEALILAKKENVQAVGKVIKEHERLLKQSLELTNQAREQGVDANEFLLELAENILDQQKNISDNIQVVSETIKPVFRRAVETEKQIYDGVINLIDKEDNHESLTNLEIREEQINLEFADWQQTGKPGMNETGSTQVARPEGVGGGGNSKKCLCQVSCGQKIVEDCILQSGNYMYQMLNCRGDCTKYNLIYGCGMEAGCDESCWDNYYDHCGLEAHENCLADCEETFGI